MTLRRVTRSSLYRRRMTCRAGVRVVGSSRSDLFVAVMRARSSTGRPLKARTLEISTNRTLASSSRVAGAFFLPFTPSVFSDGVPAPSVRALCAVALLFCCVARRAHARSLAQQGTHSPRHEPSAAQQRTSSATGCQCQLCDWLSCPSWECDDDFGCCEHSSDCRVSSCAGCAAPSRLSSLSDLIAGSGA